MTTSRPIPAWRSLDPPGLAPPVWRSTPGAWSLFFEPTGDGVAGHAEGASQATQAAALFIGAQDFLPLLLGVTVGLRLLAAAAPTIGAQVTLFAIARATVSHELVTPAINAFDRNRNHTGEFTLSHLIEPLPYVIHNNNRLRLVRVLRQYVGSTPVENP